MQEELLNKKDERVARIEAIRLFLAYASYKDFVVYQMDVKSAFLYGKIEEEVYVCQPLGFEDPDFPDRVYKVEKALYGLHQAPRAWYETLSTYLLENRFRRGQIDKTLFIKRDQELVGGSEVKDKEGSEKREESSSKRAVELQSMMEVIPDEEEVAVDAIPLATKPPSIVDWKIIKEGKIGYYQSIRADGNSKRYSSMIQMLKSFDKEDLEII
ncbi:putative ribonuclease H-like domain-containing protein [Tanacetum coccineum]